MSYIDTVIANGTVTEIHKGKVGEIRGDARDKLGTPIKVGDRVYFEGTKGLVIGYVTRGYAGVLNNDYSQPYNPANPWPKLPQHKWRYYAYVTVRVTHAEDAHYGNVAVNVNASNVFVDNPAQ